MEWGGAGRNSAHANYAMIDVLIRSSCLVKNWRQGFYPAQNQSRALAFFETLFLVRFIPGGASSYTSFPY